jgi:N-acetylneuraminic acid mutarotase
MKHFLNLSIFVIMISATACSSEKSLSSKWDSLSPIPDSVGFAGSFGGTSNGALIVAGGANFPDGGAPWTGSKKVWHDRIFALESPDAEWKMVGRLPQPLGYGVSAEWKDNLIIAGGSGEEKHYADVIKVKFDGQSVTFDKLPDLPKPIANATGVVLGGKLYILGGTLDHSSQETESNFWALDLEKPESEWEVLEPWPGPSRMLAVAGTDEKSLYLFSGAQLIDGQRQYLKDAYRYTVGAGWTKIAELPQAVVAAPSPAFTDQRRLVIFGGDDGSLVSGDPTTHPGFPNKILSYDPSADEWESVGEMPAMPPVTVPLVVWKDHVVIPGGEIRPSVRTTKVLVNPLKVK